MIRLSSSGSQHASVTLVIKHHVSRHSFSFYCSADNSENAFLIIPSGINTVQSRRTQAQRVNILFRFIVILLYTKQRAST